MFFKVLLVLIGIYFVFRLIGRSIVSFFLGSMNNNANEQIRQQEEVLRRKKKKEGEVSINYQPKQEKNFGKEDGDYIDFEEVK